MDVKLHAHGLKVDYESKKEAKMTQGIRTEDGTFAVRCGHLREDRALEM